jgi:hypothetical protein
MTTLYSDRTALVHVDGTTIFKTDEDDEVERQVAVVLAEAWKCEVKSFGRIAVIDWWFGRDGRLVGIGELKSRSHASTKYPTVFLNVRKWLALTLGSIGLGVPAMFVVQFTDGLRFINVAKIDATRNMIGGCKEIKKARDVEPMIEVDVAKMNVLKATKPEEGEG